MTAANSNGFFALQVEKRYKAPHSKALLSFARTAPK
jgi:hypothetical protein